MNSSLSTRDGSIPAAGQLGGGFAGSFALHALMAAALVAWGFFSHSGQNWGASNATAGAIQATIVSSIPLPPKQPTDQQNVLATERPSPAPEPPKPKAVEAPKPDAVPIPIKTAKPLTPPKVADRTTPAPLPHVQPAPPTNKATTGEAAGLRIAMSSVQTRVGTSSVGVPDQAFGARFAYYVQQITQKVASQWYTGMLDANASGHRVYITFDIQRDGTPANVRIAQPSGDSTLDQTALSAVRHIDTFPPLPDGYTGSRINVTYYFDPPAHP
jgi:periplasmic protein TonB